LETLAEQPEEKLEESEKIIRDAIIAVGLVDFVVYA